MDRLFNNNTTLKLMSVLLAVILWFQVAGELPQTQRMVRGVRVNMRSLPENLAVADIEPETITVYVRGRGQGFYQLSKEDFEAQVDLSGAHAGRLSYVVDRVEVPKGVTLADFQPGEVIVRTEPVVEREIPVTVAVRGKPASGYRVGLAKSAPLRVVVRGTERVVGSVRSVRAAIDIEGETSPVETDRPVTVLDADGDPVQGVTVSPKRVTVIVPVTENVVSRSLRVRPSVTGEPAKGYAISQVSTTPAEVVVKASEVALRRLTELATQPVVVDGATGDVYLNTSLVLPEGFEVVGESADIDVTVQIARQER